MNIPNINIPNIPIPSSASGYVIYSVVIIAITELIVYLISKFSMVISTLFKISVGIFMLCFIWKNFWSFEWLKATVIFLALFVIVTVVKSFISTKGSSGGTSVTVRYLGKVNGVDKYEYSLPGEKKPEVNLEDLISTSNFKNFWKINHRELIFTYANIKFSVNPDRLSISGAGSSYYEIPNIEEGFEIVEYVSNSLERRSNLGSFVTEDDIKKRLIEYNKKRGLWKNLR